MPVQQDQAARRYYVSGTVQGVGYRYFAQGAAKRLGLAGYTRNLRDGRVEVYAIGPAGGLDALRADLERGPHSSSVSGVHEEQAALDPRHADGFSIEYED
jgi:acylphosphatase